MTEQRRTGGGTFNIGSQQAGAIYQAAGDQVVHHGEGTLTAGVLNAVSDLRNAVAAADLPPAEREVADKSLDVVDEELQRPEPDKIRVAGALERMAGGLLRAGRLARATESLRAVAGWLGPAGLGLLKLLA